MIAFVLIGMGSSYYHWDPTNQTLFWDRLPLALIFSSILGVTIIERVSVRWGALLFFPLVAAGVASVLYWHLGNAEGRGDLRFYGLVQGGAILAVPILVLLFPPRYTGARELLIVVAIYAFAKVFEMYDAHVYRLGEIVSGHTIKHLLGGLAAWRFLQMLRHRKPAAPAGRPGVAIVDGARRWYGSLESSTRFLIWMVLGLLLFSASMIALRLWAFRHFHPELRFPPIIP